MDLNNMDRKEFLRRMDVYDIPKIYYADYAFYFDNVATNMQTQEHIAYDWLYDLVFKRISQNSLRRDYIVRNNCIYVVTIRCLNTYCDFLFKIYKKHEHI